MQVPTGSCREIETVTAVIMLIPVSPGKNRETQITFPHTHTHTHAQKLFSSENQNFKRLRLNFGVTRKLQFVMLNIFFYSEVIKKVFVQTK